MEDEESLQSCALIGQLPDSVQDKVNDFLADGVVAPSVVVCSIFLSGDQLLRMEELTVGAGSDFIDDGRLEINEDGAGHVLSCSSFAEEGVEGVVSTSNGLVARHLTVWLDAVLEAVQLPARVTDLHSGLTDMDRDTLTLKLWRHN